jgi:hypothetical protein
MSDRSGTNNRGGNNQGQQRQGRQSGRGQQRNRGPDQQRGQQGRQQAGQRRGQQRQPGQQSQRGGQPPQGPPGGPPQRGSGGGDDGVSRRQVLYGGAGLAAVVGGWFVFLRDDGGPDNSTPEGAVRTYVEALDNTDEQQYNEIIHPDGQLQELDDGDLDPLEPADISINNIEIIEEGNEEATARVDFSVDGPAGSQELTTEVQLRQTDDGWKVYADPTTFY